MKVIDLSTYARRDHFNYFRSLAYPYVGVTVNVDVTELKKICKSRTCSFYLSFLHAVALAADQIPEFRQRIHDDGIVEYPECPTSHIELLPDSTYCYCTLHHHMPFDQYIESAESMRQKCRTNASIEEDDDVKSMYFISSLPWIHYTAMIQPVAGGDESNPRFTWGKFEEMNGRLLLPVTVLAHHALIDGVHIGRFYSELDKEISHLID